MQFCDFCGEPDPIWAFYAHEFDATMHVINNDTNEVEHVIHQLMEEKWLACRVCTRLITENKLHSLAMRSLSRIDIHVPEHRDAILRSISAMHEAFMQNKTGGPVPA